MGNPNHLPRLALLASSILTGQERNTNMDVDALAPRTVACSPYVGLFGVEAFRQYATLLEWSKSHEIKLDQFQRPTAVGIHLDDPFQTALDSSRYLACVWVPSNAFSDDPDVIIGTRQGGAYAFSEYIGPSVSNTWTQTILMQKQLEHVPGNFVKDPDELGWWEQYSPASWSDLISGRLRSATVGFKVHSA